MELDTVMMWKVKMSVQKWVWEQREGQTKLELTLPTERAFPKHCQLHKPPPAWAEIPQLQWHSSHNSASWPGISKKPRKVVCAFQFSASWLHNTSALFGRMDWLEAEQMKAGLQWGRTSGARCLSTVLCLGHKRKSGWGRSWEISKSNKEQGKEGTGRWARTDK